MDAEARYSIDFAQRTAEMVLHHTNPTLSAYALAVQALRLYLDIGEEQAVTILKAVTVNQMTERARSEFDGTNGRDVLAVLNPLRAQNGFPPITLVDLKVQGR